MSGDHKAGERLTDEQFAEVYSAISIGYDGPPDMSPWVRDWLGPDGGMLNVLNELRDERARLEQLEAAVSAVYVSLTGGKLRGLAGEEPSAPPEIVG